MLGFEDVGGEMLLQAPEINPKLNHFGHRVPGLSLTLFLPTLSALCLNQARV